jgi:hypothetical protein
LKVTNKAGGPMGVGVTVFVGSSLELARAARARWRTLSSQLAGSPRPVSVGGGRRRLEGLAVPAAPPTPSSSASPAPEAAYDWPDRRECTTRGTRLWRRFVRCQQVPITKLGHRASRTDSSATLCSPLMSAGGRVVGNEKWLSTSTAIARRRRRLQTNHPFSRARLRPIGTATAAWGELRMV